MLQTHIIGIWGTLPDFFCGNTAVSALIGGKWAGKAATINRLVGIRKRRVPRFTQTGLPDYTHPIDEIALACCAAKKAIAISGNSPEDIDRIIFVSGTATQAFKNRSLQRLNKTATELHRQLGLRKNTPAEGRDRACAGFLSAVCEASLILGNPSTMGMKILVVISNDAWNKADRDLYTKTDALTSLMVFGTGASAVVLEGRESSRGIIGFSQLTDSALDEELITILPGHDSPQGPFASRIESATVTKNFIPGMMEVIKSLEEKFPESKEADIYLLHQPNHNLMQGLIDTLGVDPRKVPLIVKGVGNISGAIIPLTASHLLHHKKIKSGDRIVCASIGDGERAALYYVVP